MNSDYGHWHGLEFDPEEHFGFVYLITNTKTDVKYLGCKMLHRVVKKPPLKGKKRKRKVTKDSDWRKYTGSSDRLNADIATHGKENFTFEILELADSKWDLGYKEYSRIIKEDAIPRNDYLNGFLGRIGRCPNNKKY